jgi:hypothetical protein
MGSLRFMGSISPTFRVEWCSILKSTILGAKGQIPGADRKNTREIVKER